jgi:aldose 1-epimerase
MKKGSLFSITLVTLLSILTLSACKDMNKYSIQKQSWGTSPDGKTVDLYTMENSNGMKVVISTFGADVVKLFTPDKNGKLDDVVLGYDTLEPYFKNPCYFGATIGRYGNRIANAKMTIDGVEYSLPMNDGKNHLHGGTKGLHMRVWTAEPNEETNSLKLTYFSKDGEEGYPGNMDFTVVYTLTEDNALQIDYKATTDKDCVVNMTNHSYFNLKGEGTGDMLGHELVIHSEKTTPVDSTLIPTGKFASVEGTPFDFRTPHTVGERVAADDAQIGYGSGYDHNYVLDDNTSLREVAVVTEPVSGRVMTVLTTEPGIQFYSGNYVDVPNGKNGHAYGKYAALCLETQHFPDSPNQPNFPSTLLKAGDTYNTTTVYRFSTK